MTFPFDHNRKPMRFDSLVARATTLAICSMISKRAEEYATDQDMDSYWTCISVLTLISQRTGHDAFHTLPDETRAKALQFAIEMRTGRRQRKRDGAIKQDRES